MTLNGQARQVWRTVTIGALLAGAGVGAAQDDSLPLYNPALRIEAGLYNNNLSVIKGPEMTLNSWGQFNYKWSQPSVEVSRNSGYTLIHYYGESSSNWNWDAAVFVVNIRGIVKRLDNDKVKDVKFSTDGTQIVGIGDNTLRVWNLTGNLKLKTFDYIEAFIVKEDELCLEAVLYPKNEGILLKAFSVRRYRLPELKLLSIRPKYNDKSQYVNSCYR